MADLATSNAVDISYVHRVLQASHTFFALYMREQMTLAQAELASRLMRDAMLDSVAALQAQSGPPGA